MRTLLLNASFEPLCVVSIRRAVVLVLQEKAEVVAELEVPFRSRTMQMAAPSVIRLRRYVKIPYRTALPLTRRNVLARDHHRCAYCKKSGNTIDHVIPRSRGGANSWENVVAACQDCNNKKDDPLLSELGWTLDYTPKSPKGWSWIVVGVNVDPSWEPWLDPAVISA